MDFKYPEMTFVVNLTATPITIDLAPSALYIRGTYLKFVRNLPQTPWDCYECHGSKIDYRTKQPCGVCHGTGRVLPGSIAELIFPLLLEETMGTEAIFHGAGREDFDVRCFGTGCPFVIEIKNPRCRQLDLASISQQINTMNSAKMRLKYLNPGSRLDVAHCKDQFEDVIKVYHALIYLGDFIDPTIFSEKMVLVNEKIVGKKIYQRTPLRVVRRCADKTREKIIHRIEAKYIDPVHIFCKITADGGTYIKELISGDQGRTNPSFASVFNIPMICTELDVVEIQDPLSELPNPTIQVE